MTQEEKAKRYDEALERAKKVNRCEADDREPGTSICEYIFPEIHEPKDKDERIRKDIIKMVTNTCKGEWFIDSSKEECLSWLEKQGEQKAILNVPTRDVILSIWDLGNEWKELTNGCISTEYGTQLDYIQKHWQESEYYLREKQGELVKNNEDDVDIDFTVYHPLKNGKGSYESIPYSFYGTLSSFDEDKDMIDFLRLCFYTEEECNEWIKQNESTDTCDSSIMNGKEFPASEKRDFGYFSKPTDKVEPKFHVGDWIIFNGLTLYINDVVEGYYRTISIGGIHNSYYWDIDNIARLWTIQDAKDGDVLCEGDNVDGDTIFIFKERLNDESIITYCDYDKGELNDSCNLFCYNVMPATKEQRDLLFLKMHEAGYEWDFEKKELKKIKQKPTEWNIFDYRTWQYIVADVLTKKEGIGQYLDNGTCKNIAKYMQEEWSKKLSIEQKPDAWSEEDEKMLADACIMLDWYNGNNWWKAQHIKNWLKALKQRIGG